MGQAKLVPGAFNTPSGISRTNQNEEWIETELNNFLNDAIALLRVTDCKSPEKNDIGIDIHIINCDLGHSALNNFSFTPTSTGNFIFDILQIAIIFIGSAYLLILRRPSIELIVRSYSILYGKTIHKVKITESASIRETLRKCQNDGALPTMAPEVNCIKMLLLRAFIKALSELKK